MKELTIEQKAQRYDEAIKKAKDFYKGYKQRDNQLYADDLESIFPELKESEESENERIRKEIIAFIKKRDRSGCDYDYDQWIAWLEKQEGCEYIKKDWLEHIKQSWYKEGFIDGKYSGETSKEWTINDDATLKELIDFLENGTTKLQHDLTRYANWLKIQFTPIEKQDEQKPVENKGMNLVEEEMTPFQKKVFCIIDTAVEEEQGLKQVCDELLTLASNEIEQKPADKYIIRGIKSKHAEGKLGEMINNLKSADKIEPKFHEGDWITNGEFSTQIVAVGSGLYVINRKDMSEVSLSTKYVEKWYHLWTIQDARDCDVLYHKSENGIEYIVMNKGLNENNNIDSYFRYNSISGFGIDVPSVLSAKCDIITPATKEQRDLLFKKMKEAEYEWDSDTKELKKIEQKSDSYCKEHCKGFQETGKCFADGECKAKREAEQNLAENAKPQSSTPMSYGKELEKRMCEACNRFYASNTDSNRL